MNRLFSDRGFQIVLLVVGIILAVDILNVFVIGGPSVSTLVFGSGTTGSVSAVSPSQETPLPVPTARAASSDPAPRTTRGNISSVQKVGSPSTTLSAIYVPTKATPVPTIRFVVEVTPIEPSKDEPEERYVPIPTTPPLADEYVTIYAKNLTYPNEPTAMAFELKEAPLVIKYTVSPVVITDFKVVTNRSGTKAFADSAFNVTRPSENAWFTVTLYDRDTGQELEEDGYGETYDLVRDNILTVHEAGNYLVQFDGANANVQIEMSIKRKGNIE